MLPMEWVLLLAGLAAGAVLAWMVAKGRIAAMSERATHLTAELVQKASELDAERLRANNAETARATLEGEKSALEDARRLLPEKFESLAATALRNNNQAFLDLAKEKLGAQHEAAKGELDEKGNAIKALLGPIETKFGEFKQEVENLKAEHISGRSELREQISNLRSLNERLSADAESLVTALKGSAKTQGDWGEFVLEKLLEAAGLREGHEYRKQQNFTREDGTRARPDVILDLPGARHLVIDSKVSLDAYTEYCGCESEEHRALSLAKHISSMRSHIRGLSLQNYQALHALSSLDFVIMFVPIEPAFMLVLANDGKLWEDAWSKNVLLVSPSTLLFALRTVAQLWRQERQNRGIQQVLDRSRVFYEELVGFAEDLVSVGEGLRKAQESYDSARWKLSSKKGNVIRQAEMLKDLLEKKPSKLMPKLLVEEAMGDEQPVALAASAESTPESGS